jgi:predicted secreted hydrolase
MNTHQIVKLVMISLVLILLSSGIRAIAGQKNSFLSVTGPCNLLFPKDHGPHLGYRTEWWYYTGNLTDRSGNPYGFQLTFFRIRISPPGYSEKWPKPASSWRTRHIYLGHAAVTDINGKQHIRAEIMAREALDMAGSSHQANSTQVFIRNWSVDIEPDSHRLSAYADDFSFELNTTPEKPPVLHGDAGYSRKGSTPERASCYYSFTRLKTTGTLTIHGETFTATGTSWMDHEFSTAPLEPGLVGWDWMSLQLSDRTEIMIYMLRKADNRLSAVSSGTFIDTEGIGYHLGKDAFRVEVIDTWKSPYSQAVYPARWRIKIASLLFDLDVVPNLANQEMRTPETTNVSYWEGSVSVTGTKNSKPVKGHGYVELTGYTKPFDAPM